MLIDWFTVIAQVVNFLILVGLLKRFLYRPILDAIDAREKRVAAELAGAAAKKAEAEKERDEFQHKNQEFEQQRAALLSRASDEAKAERLRLIDEARQDADTLSAKRQETLLREQQSLGDALSRRARDEVFAIARKTLADLAGTTLEERMVEVFIHRLRELDAQNKGALVAALKATGRPLLVRTTLDLPPEQRATLESALKEALGADTQVQFETRPDLVSGIEISSDGHKLAWSIADYLDTLENGVGELLKGKAAAAPEKPQAEGHKNGA